MTGRRKYTDEQIDEAARLRELGLSCAEIGRRLGMSEDAVDWHCLRLGADSPRARALPQTAVGPASMRRGGHVVRRFARSEDERLIAMEREGVRISDIARALHRPPNSVRVRLMVLARHEARLELSAGEEAS